MFKIEIIGSASTWDGVLSLLGTKDVVLRGLINNTPVYSTKKEENKLVIFLSDANKKTWNIYLWFRFFTI